MSNDSDYRKIEKATDARIRAMAELSEGLSPCIYCADGGVPHIQPAGTNFVVVCGGCDAAGPPGETPQEARQHYQTRYVHP